MRLQKELKKDYCIPAPVLTFSLFVISVGVMLMVGEFIIRNIFVDITTTGDNTSFFSQKWKGLQRLNHLGFRERELPISKGREIFRIAVIGDSFTYGQGVPEEDRFSNLLERQLKKFYEGFEVINFGRPGAETVDHLLIFRDVVAKLSPDFVLLQWFINDVEGVGGAPRPLRLVPSDRLSSWLHQNSALYFLLNHEWQGLQSRLGLVESYTDYMLKRFSDSLSQDSRKATESLKEFILECKQQGIEVGIVLFPTLSQEQVENYPFAFLHERVLEQCKSANIPCLDLRDAFRKVDHDDVRQLWANRLDPHPGTLAHRIASQEILKAFGRIWQEKIGQQLSQYIKRDKNFQTH